MSCRDGKWKLVGLVALGEQYSAMKTIIQGIQISIKRSFPLHS